MKKNIFNLIEKLDIYTQKRLKKWLQSPIHNQNEKLLLLVERFLEKNEQQAADKNSDFSSDSDASYNTVSELAKRVREFLAYEYWQSNAAQINLGLAENLYQRKLAEHTDDALRKTADALAKIPNRNADWHLLQYQFFSLSDRSQQVTQRQTGNTFVVATTRHLDIAYFVKRLTLYADIISYNNVLKLNLANVGYPELLAYITAVGQAEEPLVKLHIALLNCLLDEENETHFHTFKHLLNDSYALLNEYECRDRSIAAINYCIRKINTGKTNYYNELFELYKILLQNKFLLENNTIQYLDYKNIISVGLQLKAYHWVERFLYDYNEKLPENWRENALTYNLAKLNFAQKNYSKVIKLLQIVEYQDIIYTLDSRTTLLKTYYELHEFDAFDASAESFRIFLLRNQTLSLNIKKMYQNFLRFIKQLILLNPKDEKKRLVFLEKIQTTEPLADKNWLLEKLNF